MGGGGRGVGGGGGCIGQRPILLLLRAKIESFAELVNLRSIAKMHIWEKMKDF